MLVEHFRADRRAGGADGRSALARRRCGAAWRTPWPGNVRELRNVVERLIVLADAAFPTPAPPAPPTSRRAATPRIGSRSRTRRRAGRRLRAPLPERAARGTDDNVSEAARRAGIDRVYLLRLMGRYGLRKPRE